MGVLSAVAEIKARGSIDIADVLRLRRNTRDGGPLTADEAETLLALNDACPVQDPAWTGWFVETLADYIVDQIRPEGYLTLDNASWLMARVARDGRVGSPAAMELLLAVLDRARWVPPSLVRFTLDQLKGAVVNAAGSLGATPQHPGRRTVAEADAALLRRVLCAFDGDGHLPVTRPEAEVLLDLDAATAGGDHHPSWRDLYVKAMANCALTAFGYAVPPRALALADAARGAARPIGGLEPAPDPACRLQSGAEREIARLARQKIEIVTGEPVVLADASWLAGRIEADAARSPNVRALLAFLVATGAALAPVCRRWWAGPQGVLAALRGESDADRAPYAVEARHASNADEGGAGRI
jgi:hypothetical protein